MRPPGTIARPRDDVLHSRYGTVDCRSMFSSGRATVSGRRLGITVSDGTPAGAAVDFQTSPEQYRHWRLAVDGPVATLTMQVDPDGGLRDDYELKLNSYDLAVDIELARRRPAPALRAPRGPRRRAHRRRSTRSSAPGRTSRCWPGRRTTTRSTSASSPTRPATASRTPRRTPARSWIAAVNGTAAGGGYELALACDEIILVDDRASAVSLPEVPLLAVLPGTGGLTRVVDKRHVRRDLADVFATRTEGSQGPPGRRVGPGRRARRPAAASPRSCGSGPMARAGRVRPARPTAAGVAPRPARRGSATATAGGLRARRGGHRPRARRRHHHRPRPGGSAAAGRRGARRRRRRVLAARGVPGARRRDPATSASTSRRSARGCCDTAATRPPCSPPTTSSATTATTGWSARSASTGPGR